MLDTTPTVCSGVPGFQQAGTGPERWNSAHGQHTLAAQGPARRPCRPPAHTKPAHPPLPSPSAALPDDAGLSQRLQEDMATSLPTRGGGVSGGNQKGPGSVSWGKQGPWPGAAHSQSPVSVFWGKLTHTHTHTHTPHPGASCSRRDHSPAVEEEPEAVRRGLSGLPTHMPANPHPATCPSPSASCRAQEQMSKQSCALQVPAWGGGHGWWGPTDGKK